MRCPNSRPGRSGSLAAGTTAQRPHQPQGPLEEDLLPLAKLAKRANLLVQLCERVGVRFVPSPTAFLIGHGTLLDPSPARASVFRPAAFVSFQTPAAHRPATVPQGWH